MLSLFVNLEILILLGEKVCKQGRSYAIAHLQFELQDPMQSRQCSPEGSVFVTKDIIQSYV